MNEWLPMETAPKDGTPCLVLAKQPIGYWHDFPCPQDAHPLWARAVVAFHKGIAPDGFDGGWSLAGPFGRGVGQDQHLEGWLPIPMHTKEDDC